MIPRLIANGFPSEIRTRGDNYFSRGLVRLVRTEPENITARVRGTTEYGVDIYAQPGTITAMCSCPFAEDNGICKHIWATLRLADEKDRLDGLVRAAGKNADFVTIAADFDDVDDDESDDDVLALEPQWAPPSRAPHQPKRPGPPPPRPPEWKALLETARRQMETLPPWLARGVAPAAQPAGESRIVYIVDFTASSHALGLVVELGVERLKRDGTWDAPVQFRLPVAAWHSSPDAHDRQIAQMLIGAVPQPYDYTGNRRPGPYVLDAHAIATTLPLICETGRCRLRREPGERPIEPVAFDSADPWVMRVRVTKQTSEELVVEAVLGRGADEMPLSEPAMIHSVGILVSRSAAALARFDHAGAFPLVSLFRGRPQLVVREPELAALLELLYALPHRPAIELPPGTSVSEVREAPRLGVVVHPDPNTWRRTHHRLAPFFVYGTRRLSGAEQERSLFDRETLVVHHRDLAREEEARERLATLGAKEEWYYAENARCLTVHGNKLARLVGDLVMDGWRVEANGAAYRAPGARRASVRSGVDWFELSAGVRFGDVEVSLNDLLAARRQGATTIALPGGDVGLIPVDWLARLAPLAGGGTVADGALRFKRSQAALLDALLAVVPEPDVDAAFERARAELRSFERVAPANAPRTFRGTLREYQREGLGWLHFLRTFGFGGCLADDMGLGKTVQVLALLEARRVRQEGERRPSLVVVPRSLVFNWMREAQQFTPKLRMLDYTGTARRLEDIGGADVVITTYGTLRRDAPLLAPMEFDYAILDEAQAIKTASSASAKAARLLNARHRLAMTGTPIENRVEELWSLFEFLNPGMLGASTTFAALVRLSSATEVDAGGAAAPDRGVLSRALRPVILRRTKAQVASELPPRIEQTIRVELEGAQRKFYDGLLESYRASVLERVDRLGLGKARMHILEALLRLRQAACHPVLADARKTTASSAKLDALVPALEEVIAEGHKALVFSQFTSFLDLVRARLDAAGMTYEYLDGKTRDRQARVDRFQTDPACPLFLISLKAGGHGLNLTAAEYVFILDPWWNPAVEAQAVDRAHRIGQTKQVIATRIVAQDTVEEKILELQASKRALADAILGQDQGVLAQIGREELELLLG